jgi:pyruvate-ferredoxin/flavodoxin oxidoreductase
MAGRRIVVEGNEAAARVAHQVNEVIAIYPITPASAMGEYADAWSAAGQRNVWGQVPEVVQLQSEAGAAGTVHGALQAGALTTTFTASQGLLLMIPNMYKIAGELTPAVIHVAARSLATHALSIFGDHSDVMSVRGTGWGMLFAASVQEAQDFALIAQAVTLRARVPFLHVQDGFRTSHEVARIEALDADDLRALLPDPLIADHRARALDPDRPVLRGTAQNPDVFFQSREAANGYYDRTPAIVDDVFDAFAARTGRRYRAFAYHGAPDAERVLVLMGSGATTARETVDALNAAGEKVGLLQVVLYRPFDAAAFVAAMPPTARSVVVLDRTKEPGGAGEPLYQDVLTAFAERHADGASRPRVLNGRYGLGSKEFTPRMAKAALDALRDPETPRSFTVGIVDDVTHLSLPVDGAFATERADVTRAVFYGLGSDGTVGATKNSVKIIGEGTDLDAQGYFVYDSKKSGAVTVSHLRFGPAPVASPYLIESAGFIGVHRFDLLLSRDVLSLAAPGATVLLNAPFAPGAVWDELPVEVQRLVRARDLKLFTIDGDQVAQDVGMGGRINTIMQTCFFALSGVLPKDEAIAAIKHAIDATYGKRGGTVLARNHAAVDAALAHLHPVPVPAEGEGTVRRYAVVPAAAPDFVQRVTARIMAGEGDGLPVSAFPIDGTYPTDTAKWEKRSIAHEVPIWEPDVCTQCNLCAIACPHAAIRVNAVPDGALTGAPDGLQVGRVEGQGRGARRPPLHRPARPRRLHRLRRLRRRLPGARQTRAQAQGDQHGAQGAGPRAGARQLELLRTAAAPAPRLRHARSDQGLAAARTAVRVLRRLCRLRRDALPQAPEPAVRRPPARRERHRLLVDLRRQPAHHPLGAGRRRPRSRLVELALRGRRRVRLRHAPRGRRPRRPSGGRGREAAPAHRRRARHRPAGGPGCP